MSGITDFLFSGSPVPPQPTGSDASTSFPLWQQQFVSNLANAATNLAQTPYTPFPGPQVAAPSGATQQSWQMAQNNVGNWQPDLQNAGALTNAASQSITGNDINQYMNPYMNTVVGGITGAINNNLFNNILPQIQSQYVGFGQAGSPQQSQAMNNAIYQNQIAVGNAVAPAYEQGWGSALQTAQAEQQAKQTAGAQYGQLGALTSQLGAADTGQIAAVGQAQDTNSQNNINAALNNFYAQQQWPYQNLGFASNIIRGQAIPTNTQTVGLQYSPSSSYSASPLQSFLGATTGLSSLGLKKGGHVGSTLRRRARFDAGGPAVLAINPLTGEPDAAWNSYGQGPEQQFFSYAPGSALQQTGQAAASATPEKALGALAGNQPQGGGPASGIAGISSAPSIGADVGDPNSTAGQIAGALIGAMNPLASPMEAAIALAQMANGSSLSDIAMPPSIAGLLGKAFGITSSDGTSGSASEQGAGGGDSASATGPNGTTGSAAEQGSGGGDSSSATAASNAAAANVGKSQNALTNTHGTGIGGSGGQGIGVSGTGTSTGGTGKGGVTAPGTGQPTGAASAPAPAPSPTGGEFRKGGSVSPLKNARMRRMAAKKPANGNRGALTRYYAAA